MFYTIPSSRTYIICLSVFVPILNVLTFTGSIIVQCRANKPAYPSEEALLPYGPMQHNLKVMCTFSHPIHHSHQSLTSLLSA